MLDILITSKTRIKLLLKFFLNPSTSSYLRGLEEEFGESTNAIRLELNRLEKANMIQSEIQGNKRFFQVNQQHPLFEDVQRIVRKSVGLDIIIKNILRGLGSLKQAYLTGDLAQGKFCEIIDLVLIGNVDRQYLTEIVQKAENLLGKKIKYVIYTEEEFLDLSTSETEYLLVWEEG